MPSAISPSGMPVANPLGSLGTNSSAGAAVSSSKRRRRADSAVVPEALEVGVRVEVRGLKSSGIYQLLEGPCLCTSTAQNPDPDRLVINCP